MTLEKDSNGHPQVKAEIEIDATPEAVWQAIASLQGMKAWFMGMECDFDGRVGGKVTTLNAIADEIKDRSDSCKLLSKKIIQMAEDFDLDGI